MHTCTIHFPDANQCRAVACQCRASKCLPISQALCDRSVQEEANVMGCTVLLHHDYSRSNTASEYGKITYTNCVYWGMHCFGSTHMRAICTHFRCQSAISSGMSVWAYPVPPKSHGFVWPASTRGSWSHGTYWSFSSSLCWELFCCLKMIVE